MVRIKWTQFDDGGRGEDVASRCCHYFFVFLGTAGEHQRITTGRLAIELDQGGEPRRLRYFVKAVENRQDLPGGNQLLCERVARRRLDSQVAVVLAQPARHPLSQSHVHGIP